MEPTRTAEETKLIDEFETLVMGLERSFKRNLNRSHRVGKNFAKGGVNACTIVRSYIDQMRGKPEPQNSYPRLVKKNAGLNHVVELVQYGPDIYEVHTCSLGSGDNFGSTGQLPFNEAEIKYHEQINLVENGEIA